jgi:hypothetical protein
VLSTVLDHIAPVQSVYESSTDYLYQLITLLAFVGAMSPSSAPELCNSAPGDSYVWAPSARC